MTNVNPKIIYVDREEYADQGDLGPIVNQLFDSLCEQSMRPGTIGQDVQILEEDGKVVGTRKIYLASEYMFLPGSEKLYDEGAQADEYKIPDQEGSLFQGTKLLDNLIETNGDVEHTVFYILCGGSCEKEIREVITPFIQKRIDRGEEPEHEAPKQIDIISIDLSDGMNCLESKKQIEDILGIPTRFFTVNADIVMDSLFLKIEETLQKEFDYEKLQRDCGFPPSKYSRVEHIALLINGINQLEHSSYKDCFKKFASAQLKEGIEKRRRNEPFNPRWYMPQNLETMLQCISSSLMGIVGSRALFPKQKKASVDLIFTAYPPILDPQDRTDYSNREHKLFIEYPLTLLGVPSDSLEAYTPFFVSGVLNNPNHWLGSIYQKLPALRGKLPQQVSKWCQKTIEKFAKWKYGPYKAGTPVGKLLVTETNPISRYEFYLEVKEPLLLVETQDGERPEIYFEDGELVGELPDDLRIIYFRPGDRIFMGHSNRDTHLDIEDTIAKVKRLELVDIYENLALAAHCKYFCPALNQLVY